ncbi:uncharacterized protein [Panulirus ornatus]|uniref:uncharacterized protein isoform X2 n=1 Tax=Panulirus ornatus TaxID=150431 RepID=UPI003A840546
MKVWVLVLLVAASVAATQPQQTIRSRRSIGSWFTGFFKKWKKQPESRPVIKVPVVHTRPVYHPPVVHHHKVRYPPPVLHPKPSYGPPPRPHYGGSGGGHVKGHGGGGHIKGHGGGGHIKGHGGGGHVKGHGGGHGAGIPYGFGPIKDSDVLHAGGSYHPPPPPAGNYGAPPPPPADTYDVPPPPLDIYGPPTAAGTHVPPTQPIDAHIAPAVPSAPPVVPVVEDSYSVPVVPVGPAVPDLSNDYRAPPSFPPPMAAHGSSSSSYLDGFEPSQPIPVGPVVPAAPVEPTGPLAPLPPLYDLPLDSHSATVGSTLPPAPIQVLPPGAGKGDVAGNKRSIDGGSAAILGGHGSLLTAGGSPVVTFGAELGYDDPIIEIVFEDGEPAPAPPPPVIDPELFALPEEPVEVFFVEYSPGDNLDDIGALKLDGAQPGILHDLPEELPLDVRTHLLDSGVLNDAEIQVIDLDEALASDYLDRDTRQALEAVYTSESRITQTKVESPSKEAVDVKVHRLQSEDGSPAGVAELLSGLDHPGIEGRDVAGVLVLASGEEDDEVSEPPANGSDPEHNLVESASSLHPVVVEARPILGPIDRQWNGDPNDWRPVWRY